MIKRFSSREEETEWLNSMFDLRQAIDASDARKIADLTGLPFDDLKEALDWLHAPQSEEDDAAAERGDATPYEQAYIRLMKFLVSQSSTWKDHLDDANRFISLLLGTQILIVDDAEILEVR